MVENGVLLIGGLVGRSTHPANAAGHGGDGLSQSAAGLLIVSVESLVPAVGVEVEAASSLASLVHDKGPGFGDVVVSTVLVVAIGLRLPVGQLVNQFGGLVQEL